MKAGFVMGLSHLSKRDAYVAVIPNQKLAASSFITIHKLSRAMPVYNRVARGHFKVFWTFSSDTLASLSLLTKTLSIILLCDESTWGNNDHWQKFYFLGRKFVLREVVACPKISLNFGQHLCLESGLN